MKDAKLRFSDRVNYYVRTRPHYPEAILSYLQEHCGLQSVSVIADMGSGTGILSELFLRNGNTVYGVEPNAEMRMAGEEYLRKYKAFRSIEGSAEDTTLPDNCCDFVSAGQAFHWFDVRRAGTEFRRILRPGGKALLVWNDRREDSPFLIDYENLLLEYGTDYKQVDHRLVGPDKLTAFFGTASYNSVAFDHEQRFDLQMLRERLLSCSYVPLEGDARFPAMMRNLDALFRKHEQSGSVIFAYRARLYHHVLAEVQGEQSDV